MYDDYTCYVESEDATTSDFIEAQESREKAAEVYANFVLGPKYKRFSKLDIVTIGGRPHGFFRVTVKLIDGKFKATRCVKM